MYRKLSLHNLVPILGALVLVTVLLGGCAARTPTEPPTPCYERLPAPLDCPEAAQYAIDYIKEHYPGNYPPGVQAWGDPIRHITLPELGLAESYKRGLDPHLLLRQGLCDYQRRYWIHVEGRGVLD